MMNRNDILQILHQHQDELHEKFFVESLALFGSSARNEANVDSDIDLLVEFEKPVGFFHFFRLQDHLESLLGGTKIDLVLRESVVKELQSTIYGEAIDVCA